VSDCTIRLATVDDLETLVEFTIAEAAEAEGRGLDRDLVRRAVVATFEEPFLARYWIAVDGQGRSVACISSGLEWSDFCAGWYWWVRSIFVDPALRGTGLAAELLDHLSAEAREAGAVDLRLYVHAGNVRARRAYLNCGFAPAPYEIMTRQLR